MTIHERIKNLRKDKGLTQAELAELAGYKSHSAIAKLEKGDLELPSSKIERFAEIFGVSPSDLLGHTEIRTDVLSEEERRILRAYRDASPEMKHAIATVLGLTK